jgi:hypothetical protein
VLFFGYRREQPGTIPIKLAGSTMPQHDAIASRLGMVLPANLIGLMCDRMQKSFWDNFSDR